MQVGGMSDGTIHEIEQPREQVGHIDLMASPDPANWHLEKEQLNIPLVNKVCTSTELPISRAKSAQRWTLTGSARLPVTQCGRLSASARKRAIKTEHASQGMFTVMSM